MKINLTESQSKIVNHIDGPMLVKAGPGSGKTRVLTERIINLLNLGKKRILALTFSNKAAEEIKERVEERLGEEYESKVYIGTIHSFCLDVINERGSLIGLPTGLTIFENESDRLAILRDAINESAESYNQIETIKKGKNVIKSILNNISEYKKKFVSPEMLASSDDENERIFSQIYETYNNMMLRQNAIDFDDILFYSYELFSSVPKIAKNYTRLYKYIFVDEAQDLNRAQYKVLKALAIETANVMFVGDPAQSIYGFNGSESEIMVIDFVNDFSPKVYELNENFRSARKIIEAGQIIQPEIQSNSIYPIEGELEIFDFNNETEETNWIFNKISELLESGNKWVENSIGYDNIGIIARNRYVFNELIEKFKQNKTKFNMGAKTRKAESESDLIKTFEEGVQIIINPNDNVHYQYILNRFKCKNSNLGNDNLERFMSLECSRENCMEDCDYELLYDSWKLLIENQESFTQAIDLVSNKVKSLNRYDEDELFLIENDINMWKQHWKNYCGKTVKGQRNLAQFRNQVALGMTQNYDSEGISLLTVHMSKGLEFDVVFIMGLNEGTFPDYRAKLDKEIKEERNNMFVSITRAKRVCYLTYPRLKMMPWGREKKQNASRFINELLRK
jgi:DNA helicase-2/ATP-dependent DNA helicase PcrA